MNGAWRSGLRLVLAAGLLGLLAACASGPTAHPSDPLEPLNRSVDRFNTVVDEAALKPLATAYKTHTPDPVRTGVRNFFGNLADVWSVFNNLLQFKPKQALETTGRVAVNTVFGLLGVIDVASDMNLDRNKEDLGQTLGYWGVPPGPYLVLPLLGPSTVRDVSGTAMELTVGDPINQIKDPWAYGGVFGLRLLDRRASFLQAGEILNEVALDKYTFTRQVWLQKRRSDVYDGDPPDEPELNDNAKP
jgi:phospholipid-binding lipoprotein MlaA